MLIPPTPAVAPTQKPRKLAKRKPAPPIDKDVRALRLALI
jgi:hypothetical protein